VAAAEIDEIAFLVLLAPPAVSASELGVGQAEAMAAVSDDPLISIQTVLVGMLREALLEEPDPARALSAIRANAGDWIESLPANQAPILERLWALPQFQSQVEQLVGALGTPWNQEMFRLDPGPPLSALEIPVLALFGDKDVQAPPGQSVPVLVRHWASHPDATVETLPGLNHFFQRSDTGLPAEIPGIQETLAPQAMARMSDWITERFVGR
jgi:pimeloyl-ACP methyl ester carboxylesterase